MVAAWRGENDDARRVAAAYHWRRARNKQQQRIINQRALTRHSKQLT